MHNHDVDVLTKQLEAIRLERTNAIKRLQQINEEEADAVIELAEAKAKALRKARTECPYEIGDVLRINNRLRNEYGIVGEARKVCDTRITIRNSGTGNDYQRAWWNLTLVKSKSNSDTLQRRRLARR